MANQNSSLLPLQESYQPVTYVLSSLAILYLGIYVMLRNHYVFKPKIQLFLKNTKIKSVVLREFIIDILSSLSITTFLLSSVLFTSSDKGVELIIQNDLYWLGLCIAILAYRNIKEEQQLEMKVVIKNGLLLLITYGLLTYEYMTQSSILITGFVLIGIYILNLILNAYQDKFIELIEDLFNSKPASIEGDGYSHSNLIQSPQYLYANFPPHKFEIEERLKSYQPQLRKIKLKTKAAMTKKLLMLSLAIRISQQKMNKKLKKDNANYYGSMNGTTNEKPKRLQMEVKNTLIEQCRQESLDQQNILEKGGIDDQLEVLFVIFPIKLFQSSKLVSMMFTIFINLAFGICLDYVISITYTLQYGKFLNNLFALLLLPILPKISKVEYFNSMCLSTIWKYCLTGLFLLFFMISNSQSDWKYSSVLAYQILINCFILIYLIGFLLSESKSEYRLAIIFLIAFSANIAITYYGIASS